MKFLFLTIATLFSFSVFAQTKCEIKQIKAAKAQLASVLQIPAKNIKLVKYEHGAWSEAMGNNSGSDDVTLSVGRFVQTYTVYARQIGTTDDCVVTGIEF